MSAHTTKSASNVAEAIQYIGIDFGTYKSTMFRFDAAKGEARVIRNSEDEDSTLSLVFYEEGTEALVGTPVLDMLEHPELCKNVITEVKLHLADPITYPVPSTPKPVDVATEILRKLKRDADASGEFDGEVMHAVITYPVAFTQLEQDMLLQAALNAGFHEVHLLKEPEAAAQAFVKEGNQPGNCILVYDLGAGTFDLAILVRDAHTGSYHATGLFDGLRCGGNNFDRALYDYCDALFTEQHGRSLSMEEGTELRYLRDCRRRKENLSTQRQVSFSWMIPDSEKKTIPFKPLLDRAKFEVLIQEMVEETIKHTQALVELAHDSHHDVDTIVLIGGSSYIPLVRILLQAALPIEPQTWHNRHRAVALGAAYYANELWGAGYQFRQYRQIIEKAHQERAWNEETHTRLINLRKKLALTDAQAEQIEREVLAGSTVRETMLALGRQVNREDIQAILDEYKKRAQQLAATYDPFTFLLVGRAGVGKSSSINSLMDKEVALVGHYEATTMTVVSYNHEVDGIKFKIVDTPGLCDDLPEKGNDVRYLELIRSEVPKIDCLWFVTRLDDTRVLPDEKRAIRLVSAGCGEDIWKHAVIVFTHANDVHYSSSIPPVEQYQSAYKARTSLIRKEIALWTDSSIADSVPSVAIDNRTRTTPDGKEWLGKLYKETSERISDDAFVLFTGSFVDRLNFDAQASQNTTANTSTYTGRGTSSINISSEDSKSLVQRIVSGVTSVISSVSSSVSNAVKSVGKWLFG